jgi:phenylacetate-coenzyme A ligase PaaK-like adenylate-forming protein
MRLRALARHGIFPGDRAVHLWPRYAQNTTRGQLLTSLRALRDWLTNDVVVDLRPLSAERLDAVLTYCRSYRPALLIAYPSWLVRLAERIRAAHPRYRLPSLRLVLCTGEVLFDFQRRFLRDTFAAPVVQEYGSQDAGIIAQEDAAGVLRLNAEQMVVELLRDGNPARPGELGEVVVTHFYTEVMPFIRYATGDVARQPHRSSLPAGEAGLPVFPQPEGRTSDLLATVDARLCPMRPVVEALVEQAGLWQFHLHQPTVGSVIAMQVEGGEQGRGSAPRGGERGDAEEILRSFLGKPLHVEWRSGSGFEPLLSGKWRFVSSPVAMRLLAHDREAGMNEGRAWPHRLMEV